MLRKALEIMLTGEANVGTRQLNSVMETLDMFGVKNVVTETLDLEEKKEEIKTENPFHDSGIKYDASEYFEEEDVDMKDEVINGGSKVSDDSNNNDVKQQARGSKTKQFSKKTPKKKLNFCCKICGGLLYSTYNELLDHFEEKHTKKAFIVRDIRRRLNQTDFD